MSNENEIDPKAALEAAMANSKPKPQRIIDVAATLMLDIVHERRYQKSELAQLLQIDPDLKPGDFGRAVSSVNEILERDGGFHLTSVGSNGQWWSVASLERTSAIGSNLNRDALKKLRRASVFLQSVIRHHGDKLDANEKKRLEKQSQIYAMRYVLAARLR